MFNEGNIIQTSCYLHYYKQLIIQIIFSRYTVTAAIQPADDDDADTEEDAEEAQSSETKTGDDTNLVGLLGAMAAAVLGLLALVVTRRREEK